MAWAQVSVGSRDCPGAARCPSGGTCFAENARRLAGEADIIVVNTYLYAASLAIVAAELLPPHDLVVFDEAHEVEDIVSAALGLELGPGRLAALARAARPVVADGAVTAAVGSSAVVLGEALRPYRDKALPKAAQRGPRVGVHGGPGTYQPAPRGAPPGRARTAGRR